MSKERRQSNRAKGHIRIAYGKDEVCVSDLTENLSTEGVFIRTPYALEPGAQLQIEIEYQLKNQQQPQTLRLEGEVTRVEDTGGNPGMGIEFVNLSDADRKKLTLLINNLPKLPAAEKS